jgi:hypothetical protein
MPTGIALLPLIIISYKNILVFFNNPIVEASPAPTLPDYHVYYIITHKILQEGIMSVNDNTLLIILKKYAKI